MVILISTTAHGEHPTADSQSDRVDDDSVFGDAVATRPRMAALAAALLFGMLGKAVAQELGAADLREVSATVQLAISVPMPFLGAGLAAAVARRTLGAQEAFRTIGAAVSTSVVLAVFGFVVAAITTASEDLPWDDWPAVLITSVAVQVLAQLVGTGLGFLLPRAWIAGLCTIVVPMSLYLLLANVPIGPWVVPYLGFTGVFGPTADAGAWLRWSAIFALWGVGLNLAGWLRARNRGPT